MKHSFTSSTNNRESDNRSSDREGPSESAVFQLSDFSVDRGIWRVALLSLVVGAAAAVVALILLDLIGLFTHLAYYGTISIELVQPTTAHLGLWSVLVPVGGGLLIGAMAYRGSERIRGHGIPEAMETILINGSKIAPRLAILKPISSALSIGSGGPFGAEGPIILTGGAVGSVVAQYFKLSAIERRTLLVAGACAGMAAVFGTPVGAVLFGVELLVFEWKPRTVAPIAFSVAVATILRSLFASNGLVQVSPLFPVSGVKPLNALDMLGVVLLAAACALLAWLLSVAVYRFEDMFNRLPIHWAWWPAVGGLVIGLGGLVDQRALGVGYATIGAELAGKIAIEGLVLLLVVKLAIWSFALGSGTSGGILAPVLMMGAALGGIMAPILPGGSVPVWAMIGLAATFAGVTRSPLTAVVFSIELTGDSQLVVPLVLACFTAYLMSCIFLKRSVLTEKVSRKGFHISMEYGVEPLEGLMVRETMRTNVLTAAPSEDVSSLRKTVARSVEARRQRIIPVVSDCGELVGIVPNSNLDFHGLEGETSLTVREIALQNPIVVFDSETLRMAADRMAEHEVGAVPVVQHCEGKTVLRGIITEFDLLRARQRQLVEERHREKILGRPKPADFRRPFGSLEESPI